MRYATHVATSTVSERAKKNSLAAFWALSNFLTADDADVDVVALRNAALVIADVLGGDYRIGCEAFFATFRHRLLFGCGEPDDALRALVAEVDRRYARLIAFAGELVASRMAIRAGRR